MRIKIISDGTIWGTKVIDDKTGEIIENVRRISWDCDAASGANLKIEFMLPKAEIEGEIKSENNKASNPGG